MQGGLAPLGEYRQIWIFQILQALGKKYKFSLGTPIGKLEDSVRDLLLHGTDEIIPVDMTYSNSYKQTYQVHFDGIIKIWDEKKNGGDNDKGILATFHSIKTCPYSVVDLMKRKSFIFLILDKIHYDT